MRVPLVGVYNNRAAVQGTVSTSAGIIGIGVVGVFVIGRAITGVVESDRRFVNCYVQASRDELSKTATPYVVKRPGFSQALVPSAGNVGSAIHVWIGSGSKIITAFGATNSTILDSTTSLGAITGQATEITETTINGIATLTIPSTDNTAWFYPEAGTLTKITDADFPGNNAVVLAGGFVHIGGIAYIMGTDGYIYNSDVNSLTSWTGSNKYATNSYPDKGVCCIRRGEYIVAFGQQSFEVLKNANVPPPGSPLARAQDATQKIGAISAKAILNVRDTIYWAGSSQQGTISIYRWTGGTAEVISNPAIDAQLVVAGPANIAMASTSFYGNTHLFVQTNSITYVYCIEEQGWWEVSSDTPFLLRMDSVSVGQNIVTYALSTSLATGKVYKLDPTQFGFTDDGYAYTAMVQTAASDFGSSSRKWFRHLALVGDQEASTSEMVISWSDNDFRSWNPDPRTVDLAASHREVTKLGKSRTRAFRLTHSANTPFRLQALDLEIVPMTI